MGRRFEGVGVVFEGFEEELEGAGLVFGVCGFAEGAEEGLGFAGRGEAEEVEGLGLVEGAAGVLEGVFGRVLLLLFGR